MPDRMSASLLAPLEARRYSGSLGRNWEAVAGIWARSHCLLLEEGIASVAEEAGHIAFGLGCWRLRCSSCLRLHHGLPSCDDEGYTNFNKTGEVRRLFLNELFNLKAANQ